MENQLWATVHTDPANVICEHDVQQSQALITFGSGHDPTGPLFMLAIFDGNGQAMSTCIPMEAAIELLRSLLDDACKAMATYHAQSN